MELKKKIKAWWNERKAKAIRERKKRINNDVIEYYNVTERHGHLYLIVECRAVAKFDDTATVSDVINALNRARLSQIDFRKLNNHPD